MPLVTIDGATHPGLKREENQDYYAYHVHKGRRVHTKGILMTIADGMGGQQGGSVASKLAVEVLMPAYYNAKTHSISESLKSGFLEANRAIIVKSQNDRSLQGMGTTLTAVVLKRNKMYYAHVGDSRGYIISEKSILQVTEDHSYVASLVKAGAISEEEAEIHPDRNVITRAIGVETDLVVDTCQTCYKIKKGQYILLCSDGLYKVVSNEAILATVNKYNVPSMISKKLVEIANEQGGPDNITVLVARIEATNTWSRLLGKFLAPVR